MKRIGLLGTVLAAFLVLAGAGSASGAILCNTSNPGCTGGGSTPYPVPTTLSGSLVSNTQAEFDTTSYNTITCKVGTIEVQTTAAVHDAEVTVLKFSSCTPCSTVIAVATPWTATDFSALGSGNGWMQSVGTFLYFEAAGCTVKGQPNTCKFGSEAIGFEVEGGSPAIFEGGAGVGFEANPCGASEWRAALKITSPQPLYVV